MEPQPKLHQRAGQAPSREIPKQMGGTLIRRVIRDLRNAGLHLPLDGPPGSQVLIACSGGVDSTALAVLIAKYGKRLAGKVGLLHINHGWRGKESDEDQEWVHQLALKLGLDWHSEKLNPNEMPSGCSPEDWARQERKRIYSKYAERGGLILTGHQADEVCETVFWRLMTGSATTHASGILLQEGCEVRPLLSCWKQDLQTFLQEEDLSWREDASNHDSQLLRARFRREIRPLLDRQFPRWKEHFLRYSRDTLTPANDAAAVPRAVLSTFLGRSGIRTRRAHWENLDAWLAAGNEAQRHEMTLPEGWTLRLEGEQRLVLERRDRSTGDSTVGCTVGPAQIDV